MISGIHWVLAGLAIIGFLPLAIILYKRNRVKKILTTGLPAKATIYEIRSLFRPRYDIVYYAFYTDNNTKPWTGKLSTEMGKFKKGDVLEIYYLPQKPHLNTMRGHGVP